MNKLFQLPFLYLQIFLYFFPPSTFLHVSEEEVAPFLSRSLKFLNPSSVSFELYVRYILGF